MIVFSLNSQYYIRIIFFFFLDKKETKNQDCEINKNKNYSLFSFKKNVGWKLSYNIIKSSPQPTFLKCINPRQKNSLFCTMSS